MNRREFLAAAFFAAPYRDYSRCEPDFLRRLALEAYERRRRALAFVDSAEAARARQKWARDTFWKVTGGMPARTPLEARVTGAFERERYRVEKIVYQSQPGLYVTANLYIPKSRRPPFPGVLFQMGHAVNGKAYASYQRCCQGLVQLGFLVVGFDPVGQGERIYYPGPDPSRSRLDSADDEHTMPGRQMLLHGDTMTRMQTWDAVRSLDYLAAHPLVDPKRLASTGQSGGGTLTMMLACVDDRLAAAAVMSGNTENFACRDFNPPGSVDDAEQNFIGAGPLGFDRWDTLYPLAPKPLLIGVSEKDWFGTYSPSYLSSGLEEFEKLKHVYNLLGHGDRIEWAATPLPHGLSYDSRLRVYNWFLRWLMPGASPVDREPPTAPEEDGTLRTGHTGGQTPFQLNRRKVERTPTDLAKLLGVQRAPAQFFTLGRVPSAGEIQIEAVEVRPEPEVGVPAWLFLPSRHGGPVYLALEQGGRNARWREGDLYPEMAKAGSAVCAPDLRANGDLSPEYGRGAARYAYSHHSEENYAWASLMLGRPMLGQWVTDILALVSALKMYPATRARKLIVAAAGKYTPAALIAASMDPRIEGLYLAGGLPSFQSLVDTEEYTETFANFVPRILLHTDLPEIAASLKAKVVRGSRWDAASLAQAL